MPQSIRNPYRICPQCKVKSVASLNTCWLCNLELSGVPVNVDAEQPIDLPAQLEEYRDAPPAGIAFLTILVIIVFIGVAQTKPANLIPVAIILLPGLLIAALVTRNYLTPKARSNNLKNSSNEPISTASVIATIGILGIAAVLCMGLLCLHALGNIHGP